MRSAINLLDRGQKARMHAPVRRLVTSVGTIGICLLCFTSAVLAQFGTGADGSWTIAGDVYLTSNKNYVDLTITPGSTLSTNGFTVYVSGTLLNQGRITDLYSGGNGGSGGAGGRGGYGTPSHHAPESGYYPTLGGSAWKPGGGSGGNGGGGGSGGGGAWRGNGDYAADGGNGGYGGAGGKGGGVVRINAATLSNWGVIEADGQPGQAGGAGYSGEYATFTWLLWSCDGAGGGGGGGGGGNGGAGGTVEIYYGTLVNSGAIHAYGGSGGTGGGGGFGKNQSHAANADEYRENGAWFSGTGGGGGGSEVGTNASNPGSSGQSGFNGAGRAVVVEQIGCCTGTTGNVNNAGVVDLSDLSFLIAYMTVTPRPTLPCPEEANVNTTGAVDLSDLSLLISYLTVTPRPTLPNCL